MGLQRSRFGKFGVTKGHLLQSCETSGMPPVKLLMITNNKLMASFFLWVFSFFWVVGGSDTSFVKLREVSIISKMWMVSVVIRLNLTVICS